VGCSNKPPSRRQDAKKTRCGWVGTGTEHTVPWSYSAHRRSLSEATKNWNTEETEVTEKAVSVVSVSSVFNHLCTDRRVDVVPRA
jgi:hypothetical protein